MATRLALLCALLLPTALSGSGGDPRAIFRQAQSAVAGDSVTRVVARWNDQLRRDPHDRAAIFGLATTGWLTGDSAAAERGYRQLTDGTVLDRFAVWIRLIRAGVLNARSEFAASAAEYDRARDDARRIRDSTAEAEALVHVSLVRYRAHGAAVGLATLDTARRFIPASDTALWTTYHGRRASFLMEVRAPGADAEAVQCITLARQRQRPDVEGYCLHILGLELSTRGDLDSAVVLVHQAADVLGRAHDHIARGDALVELGNLLLPLGRYGEARRVLADGMAELRAGGGSVAYALFNLGEISRTIHDPTEATRYSRESATAFDHDGNVAGSMDARFLMAELAAEVGDLAGATRMFRAHLAWAQRTRQPAAEFDARRALEDVAERAHDWAGAARELAAVRALVTRSRMADWSSRTDYAAGRLALRRGDLASAERELTAYLRTLKPQDHMLQYRARARLAEVYARRGEFGRAERELAGADAALDTWRARLADRELRVLAFQTADDPDPDLGVPRTLSILATHGYTDAALQLAERRRARNLADLLAQAAGLRTTASPLRAQEGTDAAPQRARHSASDSVDGVAVAIGDGHTALLEYVTGTQGAPTTLFVIARAAPVRAYVLPPADSLDTVVGRFAALLESGAEPRGMARALGAALLDSAVGQLPPGIMRLVVVPDGPLHRVPFDALRTADGRYAVERYAISLAPSASVLAELRERSARARGADRGPARILAFGDVAFGTARQPGISEASVSSGVVRSAFGANGMLPRLAGSAAEVRDVARYAPETDVRLGTEASEAYLKHARLDTFQVIHFATHAVVDDQSVARTALALAPGNHENGFVSPGDLAALRLDADLVVLSACRTAGGVLVTGEGVQGLTAPLLQAGARAVAATEWRISDRSTVPFVDAFYAALARRLPVADALRAAKLDAIRRGAPPAEWAAFTIIGDPTVVVPLAAPVTWWGSTPWRWAAGVMLVLATAMAVAIAMARTRRMGRA